LPRPIIPAGFQRLHRDPSGPAFVESQGAFAVIGVVNWSTGPAGSDGCGAAIRFAALAFGVLFASATLAETYWQRHAS